MPCHPSVLLGHFQHQTVAKDPSYRKHCLIEFRLIVVPYPSHDSSANLLNSRSCVYRLLSSIHAPEWNGSACMIQRAGF